MFIFDDQKNSLTSINLILEKVEAEHLVSYLMQLLENPNDSKLHFHLNDSSYKKEITLSINVDPSNYDLKIRKVIEEEIIK